jgi:hypothetical protein
MLDLIFTRLYSSAAGGFGLGSFLVCTAVALVLGAMMAALYAHEERCSRGFAATLAVLPAVVSVVILMVSGSLGASVAVAGTFSLVRFRSAPGSAKEIGAVFFATAVGLACGMGYPGFAALFAVLLCAVNFAYSRLHFGGKSNEEMRRVLRITVPEELDYCGAFADVLAQYTTESTLLQVKTIDLGSLNRLTYEVALRQAGQEKEMIDALRCRNGNLEISLSMPALDPCTL